MKLSAYAIISLGLALAACVLALGYFWYWSPKVTEAGYWREQVAALEGEIAKSPRAKKRFEDAEKKRDEMAAAWQKFVAENTPPSNLREGGIDLSVDPWRLAIDTPKFRDSAQKALNAQLRVGGVRVLEGPEIPVPTPPNSTTYLAAYFNFPTLNYPVVIWELGTVRVRGTYRQITANVRAWSRMKRFLAVADGLAITGTSPQLEGTYNLVLVGFMKGKTFFGGVNEGTAAAGAGGAVGGGMPGAGGAPMAGPSMGGAPGGRPGPASAGPPGMSGTRPGGGAGGGPMAGPPGRPGAGPMGGGPN